jgi:uncharacterized protein (TIGR02996 family)
MDNELAFLTTILKTPADDVGRLVYADWLQERRDVRAEFLRLDCQLTRLDSAKPSSRLRRRFEELGRTLDPDWVALVRRQQAPDAVEIALAELEEVLGGLNYVVSLSVHRVPVEPSGAPQGYVTAALGPKAVVGRVQPVTGEELLAEVEECLRYRGDAGHGPDGAVLRSQKFKGRVNEVLGYLRKSVAESSLVAWFTLRSGHPFYPVMWDFACLFVKARCAVVFIGSSSD